MWRGALCVCRPLAARHPSVGPPLSRVGALTGVSVVPAFSTLPGCICRCWRVLILRLPMLGLLSAQLGVR